VSKLNLGLSFQNCILKLMLTDEQFALKCLMHLRADYFENKYLAWVFTKIKDHKDRYGSPPTKHYIVDRLKDINESEYSSYVKVIKSIMKAELVDLEYLKDELTTWIKDRQFVAVHTKQAELFNSGKKTEAFKYAANEMDKLSKIDFGGDDYVTIGDIENILKTAREGREERIPIGIPEIDKALFGGLPKKSLTTVIGGWNTGKSIFSINMAYHAVKAGYKVLYIYHEGRQNQIVLRFIARIAKISYNELYAGMYMDDPIKVQKVEDAKKFIENNIRIKEMRKVGVSIEDVNDYCRVTMKEWPYDMFIDDYGMKLSTSKRHREVRHAMSDIWNTLDLMSAELDIVVVTLAQLNRESVKENREGGSIIRSDGVSEAAQIAHVSETIFTLNKSVQNEEENKLIVCLDKARDTRAGLLIGCNTDFRRIIAYDEKLGFTNRGWDEGKSKKKKQPKS